MNKTISRVVFGAALAGCLAGPAWAGGTIEGKVNYKSPRWIRDTVVYLEHVDGEFEPADATVEPSGAKRTLHSTSSSVATIVGSAPGAPSTGHNRSVPSSPTDAICLPSGEKSRSSTPPL